MGVKGVKRSYRLFEPKEIKADSSDYALRLHPLNIWLLTPNGAKRSGISLYLL